eukprot:gnl/TRDRNA2_/TRDRNA2_62668_c0_seq1.p1 gnl/TRDRNA2_/TRDRNA2_62668_c0~~gnl/TRDRNA2_/TRDRNA2_62668_c0_seq1.p1  ORF type:complete len:267 (-),score=43.64 gnl/TRDRNA2_/TRDRNA2_62668_c0_seq1:34-810(-)
MSGTQGAPTPATLPPLADGAWRVIYYQAPHRGEQLRLLFEVTRTPFEDVRLVFPKGLTPFKANSAGDATPLAFDFVPIVQHGRHSISTTAGAMQYVGESLGLVPDDVLARAKAVMLVTGCEAMRNEVFYAAYTAMSRKQQMLETFDRAAYGRWLGHFERFLRKEAAAAIAFGKSTGPFVLGSKACYADFAIYDCLTAVWDLGCYGRDEAARHDEFPRLSALVEAVGAMPNIKAYITRRGSRYEYWKSRIVKKPPQAKL